MSGGIWRVKNEGSDHAPRACQPQSVRFTPTRRRKARAKLLERTDQSDVDGVSG